MITAKNVPPTLAPTITPIPIASDSSPAPAKAITIVETIVPDCSTPASNVPAHIALSLVLIVLERVFLSWLYQSSLIESSSTFIPKTNIASPAKNAQIENDSIIIIYHKSLKRWYSSIMIISWKGKYDSISPSFFGVFLDISYIVFSLSPFRVEILCLT